jgi:CRISPR/Cas system-associated exonuclease Cas4 (RecB family)
MEDTLEIDPETAGLIEQLILSVIKNIFDSSEDFIQTADQDNCRYCAYQAICNRLE